ncbi:hypothetical protein Sru01_65000 [Sphaerisporangium rufum]|uniref:Uncharacterized protein n=1 Tax=Sphaerisporangium rufum TaxID=1381558 RepID=A0A919R971_9ACTN|nr:hypothetical protein [Sphaerisporangium rufum]GII81518.1 hypothetical protein Sru01_65000 [Sphaerisporangium rufum]
MTGPVDRQRDPYGMSPAARISVGGYMPSTSCPPVPDAVQELVRRQVYALEQIYPAWRFTRLTDSNGVPCGWRAERRVPLTHAQRAVGLIPAIERGDVPGLVLALAVQDEIARQSGYSTGGAR